MPLLMNDHAHETPGGQPRSTRRSFFRALRWIVGSWAVCLALLVVLVSQRNAELLADAMIIAVVSIAIACASLVPALCSQGKSSSGQGSELVMGMFAGIPIRFVGTVALFVTCRYHMASTMEMIAGMTIGWYVLLTLIEVITLAREFHQPLAELRHIETPSSVKS